MPARRKESSLLYEMLGESAKQAFEQHRQDETQYDLSNELPPGIEGGVAQLTTCRITLIQRGPNKGKPCLHASAIVKRPKEFAGMITEGLRTFVIEPLCDTPESLGERKTLDQHMAWVLNFLRTLGLETENLEFDQLEDALQALENEAPHIRFRTWQGRATEQFPQPRVRHVWQGRCDYIEDDTTFNAVQEQKLEESCNDTAEPWVFDDNEDMANEQNEVSTEEERLGEEIEKNEDELEEELEENEDVGDVLQAVENEDKDENQPQEEELIVASSEGEKQNWLELAKNADAGMYVEQAKLTERARQLNISEEDYLTWRDVALAIQEAEQGEIQTKPKTGPKKGAIYWFVPPKRKRSIEVLVLSVDEKNQLASVRGISNGIVYDGIPWSELKSL